MAFSIKPRLGAENSIIMALAAAALVVGVYQAKIGPASDAHATSANDPNLLAATKKAGWQSVILIAGIALLAQDPNVVVMGGATIIAEELSYRHAIMASPDNGQIVVTPESYLPAGAPAEPVGSTALGTYTSGPLEAVAG
jgi:hypothetical protein